MTNEIKQNKKIFSYFPYVFFYFTLLYFELIVRLFTVEKFASISLLYIPLILCLPSFIFGFISNRKNVTLHKIYSLILLFILIIYYSAQLVIYHIFGFYFTISTFSLAGQATSYYKEAIQGILAVWYQLLLILAPLFLYIIILLVKKNPLDLFLTKKDSRIKLEILLFSCGFITYILFVSFLFLEDNDINSPYDLYFNSNNIDMSVPVFGAIGSTELDLYRTIFGFTPRDTYELSVIDTPIHDTIINNSPTPSPLPITTETSNDLTTEIDSTPEPVIEYEPQILPIDFETLIQTETDDEILQLNTYFSELSPTMKNEKTGIYKGYNIIYMTCEAFSPYAIDEELTPTLYKMANESYIFENFYTTGDWYTSTSDGEYMMCTGLIPMSTKNTFAKTTENYFAFALPKVLKPEGYTTMAFHNNSGTVYDRNLSHPNLGYEFYYNGNGLEMSGWPQSDLEMMEQSIPMYIEKEPFVGYYMTVSGHLNYNFSGNKQSSKHKEEVADLPYSDACKAYIACNIELDLAMEYLLNSLEEAGIADHTLIVMVADHYPYGLSDSEISEFLGHEVETTFERYKSTLILYTPEKSDSEIITKPCEAIDVLPTVLNLVGADFDSRLITGRDIFADEPGLVIFPSRSFITDDYSFKYSGKDITPFVDREITEEEINAMRKKVDNAFYVSSQIASLDYYRLIGLESFYQIEQ